MVEINYSINGKKCLGRWYRHPDRITIFLNKIADEFNPETNFDDFILDLTITEFHELGHIIGFRNGCYYDNKTTCYYCHLTDVVFFYFKLGFWDKEYLINIVKRARIGILKLITIKMRTKSLPVFEVVPRSNLFVKKLD